MAELMRLSSLPVGECGYVTQVEAGTELSERLADLGLVPGTQVVCAMSGPAGDPRAYFLRGTLLALRQADARGIQVERRGE